MENVTSRKPGRNPKSPKSHSTSILISATSGDPASIASPENEVSTPNPEAFHTSRQVPTLGSLADKPPPKTTSPANAADTGDGSGFRSDGPHFMDGAVEYTDAKNGGEQLFQKGESDGLATFQTNDTTTAHEPHSDSKTGDMSLVSVKEDKPQGDEDLAHTMPIPQTEPADSEGNAHQQQPNAERGLGTEATSVSGESGHGEVLDDDSIDESRYEWCDRHSGMLGKLRKAIYDMI